MTSGTQDTTLSRRRFLRVAVAVPALLLPLTAIVQRAANAALSDQDLADIARIEQYMDSIITMRAKFQQIDRNETLSFGTIYLQKPGRLLVDYDPPVPVRVVADGTLISYEDTELQEVSQMPLKQSTAWFLVRYPIRLDDGITISGIDRSPGGLQLTLYQTDEPEAGTVALIFEENPASGEPMRLVQWIVTDADNNEVRVGLFDVQFGLEFSPATFATPTTQGLGDTEQGGNR